MYSIKQRKDMKRYEAGLCMKCGHKPCDCKTSHYLPKRKDGKRGKRRFKSPSMICVCGHSFYAHWMCRGCHHNKCKCKGFIGDRKRGKAERPAAD